MWPTLVILDTEKVMKPFREYCRGQGLSPDLPDELADDIVGRLRRFNKVDKRLDELYLSIITNDYEYPLGCPLSYNQGVDESVLPFVQTLAETLIEQIKIHCLYDADGVLHYRHKMPKEYNFNCVILKRIDDGNNIKPPMYYQYTSQPCNF